MLSKYYTYTKWANAQLFELIQSLPEELITEKVVSSFDTLFSTIQHMWLAEEAWWKRHYIGDTFSLESESFNGNLSELLQKYNQQAALWTNWLASIDATDINRIVHYVRQDKATQISMQDLVLHICNHATFHRGQLITMLRQLNVTNLPSTDYSAFLRAIKK